ncbi:hypothetical protein [Lapidilactobacillus bayanensis]|uniref:hypothetical protein n=1 Tax=Lapidilactobacillus bayanensis TaxID=2485998 RepID=UPI000F79E664|nr:hypothetical protein [Lapidilactobacillus bayanensis]
MLIAFEGINSAVKTSILKRLRDEKDEGIYAYCSASDKLFTDSRVTLSALKKNKIVIRDHDINSALVGRKAELTNTDSIDDDFVAEINELFQTPDITFYFKISTETSKYQTSKSCSVTPESRAFLKKINDYYCDKASKDESFIVINAEQQFDNA